MKVIIIEDEVPAAEKLRSMLLEADPKITVVAMLQSVESSVAWLNTNPHPDLIFSDIRLLDGLSFDIFNQVKVDTPVIFTTAYDQYAIKAFDLNSVSYLLKPVKADKLQQSLQKLKTRAQPPANESYDRIIRLLERPVESFKTCFMVKIGQRIVSVPVEKICYFFSENKLSFLVTEDGKRYPVDVPLEELEQQLNPIDFFRANRQMILHYTAISEIHPYFKGRLKVKVAPEFSGEIIVSSEKSPEFKSWLDR